MLKLILCEMRDRRGLYDWPLWVQRLICWADNIPQGAVGAWPSQQASNDAYWANANPAELTEFGKQLRAEAIARRVAA